MNKKLINFKKSTLTGWTFLLFIWAWLKVKLKLAEGCFKLERKKSLLRYKGPTSLVAPQ